MTQRAWGMWGWADGERSRGRTYREPDQAGTVQSKPSGDRLVEVEVWHRLGVGEVEIERRVEEELALGWTTRRSNGRRSVREIQVEEDCLYRERIGKEGEDPHLASAGGAEKREQMQIIVTIHTHLFQALFQELSKESNPVSLNLTFS